MSEENVEAARSFYALGLAEVLETDAQLDGAVRDFLDEDFEVRWPPVWPEGKQAFRVRERGTGRIFSPPGGMWA